MARPRKLTMDFFIHDSNASNDKKIKLLSKKHGNDGYATFFRILESLCKEQGMALSLQDPEVAELISDDYRLRDVQHLYNIIQYCADIGLLDKQLWESERTVFSHGLFTRYTERLEERKDAADRKRKSRESKALQDKINQLNEVVTRDNPVVTNSSQSCHSPELRTQNSESESEVQNSVASDRGGEASEKKELPVQGGKDAVPYHDPFARRGYPQVVTVQSRFEGPWGVGYTDELKGFEQWLTSVKAKGKSDPSAWVAAVVNGIAKGGSRALWDEWERSKTPEKPREVRKLQVVETVEDAAEYQRRVWLQSI